MTITIVVVEEKPRPEDLLERAGTELVFYGIFS